MAATRGSLAKRWCFTVNNPTVDVPYNETVMNYLVWQHEVGEQGTPHIQGYVELRNSMRMSGLHRLTGLERAHFIVSSRKATAAQNTAYCRKEGGTGGGIWGEPSPGSGDRTDLRRLADAIRDAPMETLDSEFDECVIRYASGIKYLRGVIYREMRGSDWREPQLLVYWGPSGVGKSRRARLVDPDLYNIPVHECGTTWFDGYEGQKTLLFDDFAGGVRYAQMLRFTDGYALQVQTKGGFVTLNHEMVIITSNKRPENWYSYDVQSVGEEAFALLRRLYEFGNVLLMTRDDVTAYPYTLPAQPPAPWRGPDADRETHRDPPSFFEGREN